MRNIFHKEFAGKILFSAILVLSIYLFSSCKGRTTENVEPDGDTVEVVIPTHESSSRLTAGVDSTSSMPVNE